MKKILLVILLFAAQLSYAQEEPIDICVQNIEIAQQRYDEGRIQDIQELLSPCIKGGTYTDVEKAQALRLVTLAYIFLEDDKNAEASMLELLQTNHEFKVNPAIDPTEFINLHSQFRTEPLFNVGIRYIVNFAQPIATDLNSSLSLSNSRPEYTMQFGSFGLGLNFEYEIFDNFMLYPEIQYKSMSISRTESQAGIITGLDNYIQVVNLENQQWLSLPVSVKYLFNFPNSPGVKLYANLGASADLLLNSSRPADGATLTTNATFDTNQDPVVGFQLATGQDKSKFNYGIIAGGGLMVKLGEGFISLEARYLYSLSKVTRGENILNPTDPQQINTLIQDDVYRLNHIAISFGYTQNIYFPKQLR